MKNNKGFSLVELLAVIVILSIILALSTTSVMKIKENQDKKNLENVINSILTSAKAYETETGKLNGEDGSGTLVTTLEAEGKVKYDTSKYNFNNIKVKYVYCGDDYGLKRKFVVEYNGTKYNDCGCKEQESGIQGKKYCID